MKVSGQPHAPAVLPLEKEPASNYWNGGWVGPRAGLDVVAKRKILSPCQELQAGCTNTKEIQEKWNAKVNSTVSPDASMWTLLMDYQVIMLRKLWSLLAVSAE
jgi:hypothetical protein